MSLKPNPDYDTQSQAKVKKENPNPWALSTYIDPAVTEDQAPQNFGGPLPSFKWLCEKLLDKLEDFHRNKIFTRGRNIAEAKTQVIDAFYKEWRTVVGPNIYPALILILPHRDRSRVYGAKDHTVGRVLLDLLKIPKNSKDAEHIIKWKQQRGNKGQRMSTICVETIKKRQADIKGGILSISDVNDLLDGLAKYGSRREDLNSVVRTVVEKMSFLELGYFFDILLKKNVVRGMENRILYEWHPDANSYLSVVTSLKTVAYKLYDPKIRLNKTDLTINLGKPFAPQLAKKPIKAYEKIAEILGNDFFVEEKMDGERTQIHYEEEGEVIHYWSRKATDYTYLYGGNKRECTISPHLHFRPEVKSCVLDAEMVVYDPVRDKLLPFGILKGSAIQELERLQGRTEDPDSPRPYLMVFDLLYLNGTPLTDRSLAKRREFLEGILTPAPGYVEILKSQRASSVESIKNALDEAIQKGSEGIILKKTDSKYYIDKRNDFWLKIKPEYLEEFGENVDVLIIGREKSKKDMFYCGLRIVDNDTEDDQLPHFWSFARVANGFDKSDYRKIDEITRGKWRDSSKEQPPNSLEFGSRLPPEWIDPRDSFVIEVRARSVVKSESGKYRTGTTLYNAFSRRIREDKDWKTSVTLQEYADIRRSRHSTDEKGHKLLSKRKRLEVKRKREQRDEEAWNNYDTSIASDVFHGLTFKVLTDCYHNKERITIDDFTSLINRNGAQVTKNQLNLGRLEDLRIVSEKITIEAKELRNVGYDVIKPSWVFDCLYARRIVPVEPKHCLLVSQALEEVSKTRVNHVGVSYTTPLAVDDLTKLLDKAKVDDDLDVIKELEDETDLFGGLKVYIVHADDPLNVEYRIAKLKLEGFGAEVVNNLKDSNYVVVVNTDSEEAYSKLKDVRKKLASTAKHGLNGTVLTTRVVGAEWIENSIKEGFRLDPQDYHVPMKRNDDTD